MSTADSIAVYYPTGDGKPMAETPVHGWNMFLMIQTLQDLFAGRPDVYIGGNMMMYYKR